MKKIVIIGATGKVGSKVADQLLTQGKYVALIARNEEKLSIFKKQGAEVQAFSMKLLNLKIQFVNFTLWKLPLIKL